MREGDIRNLLLSFLGGQVPAQDFCKRFGEIYWSVRNSPVEPAAAELCSQMVGPLMEYSKGHRDEADLRRALVPLLQQSVVRE